MAEPVQPRAVGTVRLTVKDDAGTTRLGTLRQSGSLKSLFPRRDKSGIEAVLINTAGGITGGDQFQVSARACAGGLLTMTTQASERAYAARGEDPGRLQSALHVESGARLNWVPQETILFDNAHLERRLHVDLDEGASALICEPVIFGRTLMGEHVQNARFHDRIELRRAGEPLYRDQVNLRGDIEALLSRPHVARGARAMASLIYVAPDAESHLDTLRAMMPEMGGASLIGEDMLVCRLLAADGYDLRQSLVPVLTRLMNSQLPKCWMI